MNSAMPALPRTPKRGVDKTCDEGDARITSLASLQVSTPRRPLIRMARFPNKIAMASIDNFMSCPESSWQCVPSESQRRFRSRYPPRLT